MLAISNMTPVVREAYRVGVPDGGWWEEILNTDAASYGGSNVGNFPGYEAEKITAQGREYSLPVNLPPLGIAVFKPMKRQA